jgi:hypothetical protein
MYAPLVRADYYEDSAPSHGPQSATDLPTPRTGCPGPRATADGSNVPYVSIGQVDVQLYPGSLAMPTPQTFGMASPPISLFGFGVDRHRMVSVTHC